MSEPFNIYEPATDILHMDIQDISGLVTHLNGYISESATFLNELRIRTLYILETSARIWLFRISELARNVN